MIETLQMYYYASFCIDKHVAKLWFNMSLIAKDPHRFLTAIKEKE